MELSVASWEAKVQCDKCQLFMPTVAIQSHHKPSELSKAFQYFAVFDVLGCFTNLFVTTVRVGQQA